MKMCKTIPTFILLFTGYCVKNMCVAAVELESELPTATSPVSYSTKAFEQSTRSDYPDSVSGSPTPSTAENNTSVLVAGLSILFVLLSICVIIGIWNARRLSKQGSFDVTSAPSSEA